MPTKKKQSKQLKFANVTGRKKVLLVTMLALVVVGAGIIIRSFAASTDSIYTYGNGYLSPASPASGKAQTDIVTDAKSPQSVIVFPKGESGDVFAGNANSGILANTKFQLCVTMKNAVMDDPDPKGYDRNIYVNAGNAAIRFPISALSPNTVTAYGDKGYKQYCTATQSGKQNLTGPWHVYYYKPAITTANDVYLYAFTIKTITSDTTTTPAPTK